MAGLIVSSLAFALMQTLVIPALPVLQRDLHTSTQWITWTVTIYLLTGSVATPIIGRMGDQYGKVKMMLVALISFCVGSIGCLVSWNVGSLIVFRGIQGVGAAVFPLAYAIIRDEFPEDKWSVTMGTVSSTLGVGGGLGIVTAGLVIDNLNWRWLFVVSAVIGLVALILVWRFIPESPVRAPARPDIVGAVLLSGGLIALLVALTEGGPEGWTSPFVVGLFLAAAALLVAWAFAETRVAQPMVDMRMLTRRPVLFTNLTALLSGFSLYATWVLLPSLLPVAERPAAAVPTPGRLRIRHQRAGRGVVDPAVQRRDRGRRPARGHARSTRRSAHPARPRDAAVRASAPPASPSTIRRRSRCRWPSWSAGSGSASPSRPCPA